MRSKQLGDDSTSYSGTQSIATKLSLKRSKSTSKVCGRREYESLIKSTWICGYRRATLPDQPVLPRPYLSDLAVDPKHRRRGLARALVVAKCEAFVQDSCRETQLWIRVEEANGAAVSMYATLDYHVTDQEETKDKGTLLILHKEFPAKDDNKSGASLDLGDCESYLVVDASSSTSSESESDLTV
jgi:hypothetical protein